MTEDIVKKTLKKIKKLVVKEDVPTVVAPTHGESSLNITCGTNGGQESHKGIVINTQ